MALVGYASVAGASIAGFIAFVVDSDMAADIRPCRCAAGPDRARRAPCGTDAVELDDDDDGGQDV
ncbi:hypothetical protein GCM10022206_77290 [Streptomyces chiangmaiensis]